MQIIYKPVAELRPYVNNPRKNDGAVAAVAESIRQFGFKVPIIIDAGGEIVAGHTRLKAALQLNMAQVPCIVADDLTPAQIKAFRIADNKVAELAEWDDDLLKIEFDDLSDLDVDLDITGFTQGERDNIAEKYKRDTPGLLKEKFIVPPFSVLDARSGDWQKRKKAWHEILDSGKGRDTGLLGKGLDRMSQSMGAVTNGTSIFDPVLCEVLLQWFSPKGGAVLDPFAGGSVRGIVSSFLGREYHGNDLSAEQIAAKREGFAQLQHATNFYGEPMAAPVWTIGDSGQIDTIIQRREFDALLTCPPYGDLEQYSDDPADISNMDYPEFMAAYRAIFKKSVSMLKENAFIVVVVGEIRDKAGNYRNFIGDTVAAIEATGAKYYNEIILVTMIGTLAYRAGPIFAATRKIGNSHQKALIFLKSNGDDAALQEYISAFEQERQLLPMKKSILVFLRGNIKAVKKDIDAYAYDLF